MGLPAAGLAAGGRLAIGGLGCAGAVAREYLGLPGVLADRIVHNGISGALFHTGLVLLAARYCGTSIKPHDVFVFLGRLPGGDRIGRIGMAKEGK